MFLGYRHIAREIQFLPKQPHCVRSKEEDAESILDSTLNLLLYECVYLRGAGRGVESLGYGCLQCLGRPRGSGVGRDFLLYIQLYEGRRWVTKPLRQAYQCLSFIGGK